MILRLRGETCSEVNQLSVCRAAASAGVALMLALALAGCSPRLAAQQRYTGTLTGCGAPMPATLTRLNDAFAFTPDNGPLLMRGLVTAEGQLSGSLNTAAPNKPPYVLALTGQIGKNDATVQYATPRCIAKGKLTLRPATLMP